MLPTDSQAASILPSGSESGALAASRIYGDGYTVVGASYRTLAIAERERFGVETLSSAESLKALMGACGLREAAILSTCNRYEVVAVGAEAQGEAGQQRIVDFLLRRIGDGVNAGDFYTLKNAAAVRHLFRVAASLDSMVVGEAQILGQVKRAYESAVAAGGAGKYLHHLFQFAFSLAKKVRANTGIAQRGVSMSYVAVRLAEQIVGSLNERSVLVIGSGEMAELTVLHLKSHGCREIIVANRTLERAFELANKVSGSAIALSDIDRVLGSVDIVVSSISIDRPVLVTRQLERAKRSKSLFLLDLGVPRNFAADLAELDDVYLYNIDDLGRIVDQNLSLREAAAKEGELIVEYGLYQFEHWLAKVAAEGAIVSLRQKVERVCETEIERVLGEQLPADERAHAVQQLSHRISQKLAHDLTELALQSPEGKLDPLAVLPLLFDQYLRIV